MNVLITSAGRRVSLVRAFKEELAKKYDINQVITCDANPQLSSACHASDQTVKVCKINDPNYILDILEICKAYEVNLIVPTLDTELKVLAKNRAYFKTKGIEIVVSDFAFVEICRDKRLSNNFFLSRGINVPATIDPRAPVFPIFCKPANGSMSKGIRLLNSEDDLIEPLLSNDQLMFMEYLPPDLYQEFTIDAYYSKDGRLKCCVPRRRIEVRGG